MSLRFSLPHEEGKEYWREPWFRTLWELGCLQESLNRKPFMASPDAGPSSTTEQLLAKETNRREFSNPYVGRG
jgi:hypothetical protein